MRASPRHPDTVFKPGRLIAGILCAVALASTSLAAPTATTFRENPDGVGHILVVPYYTVQSGNATLLNIVNTDVVNGKAVKLRFRSANNADSLYDFTLFLAPGDVWAAEVSQNPVTGMPRLGTTDSSCTLPTQINADFSAERLDRNAANFANDAREGYVEVITMANLLPGTDIFTATTPVKNVLPQACSQGTAIPPTLERLLTPSGITASKLAEPTTGLFANWSIFNVANATSWSGAATALQAVNAASAPATGAMVLQPQTREPVTKPLTELTTDPLMRAGLVQAVLADLPDLSTPYVQGMAPMAQITALGAALAKTSVSNEYFTDDSVQAQTDWVFSMPTRRYEVAMDVPRRQVYFAANDANQYFGPGGVELRSHAVPRICMRNFGIEVRNRTAGLDPQGIDDDFVLSSYGNPELVCGAVSVLSFNAGDDLAPSALSASAVRLNLEVTDADGWILLRTNSYNRGTPLVGYAASKAVSTNIGNGMAGSFGLAWPHRHSRP